MKTTILYSLLSILLSGCLANNYSYMPLMPNEPAFTEEGQLKASGTGGFGHVEAQAAFSPIKHFTLLAGTFQGEKNQWSSEFGGAFYSGLPTKNKKLYFSLGYSFGEGNIRVENFVEKSKWSSEHFETYNSYYRHQNIQASLYYVLNDNFKQKLGIVFKRTQVSYNYLHKDKIVRIGSRPQLVTTPVSEINSVHIGNYLMVFGQHESLETPFYINWQFGYKPSSNIAEYIEKYNQAYHFPEQIAFNLAIGVKLNFY